MAWEGALQRVAEWEQRVATKAEVMRFVVAATEADLAAGEVVPTQDFAAAAVLAESTALALLDRTAVSVESVELTAAAFVGRPGAEPLVEALHKHAATVAALRTRAREFAAFMRRIASLPVVEDLQAGSESGPRQDFATGSAGFGRRLRRRNSRYFGPDWST